MAMTSSNCRRRRRIGPPTRCSTSWKPACRNGRRARRWQASGRVTRNIGTSWSRPRSSRIATSLSSTPIRISPRCRSKRYAASLCGEVDPNRASLTGPRTTAALPGGDTIVLSTADSEGNMVSWVNSNFSGFGSGITVQGYGFVLHNRGALFTLDPASPNLIQPHKRPFNTLSSGFVMKDGEPLMTMLLMGGDMQAQGHAQALLNIIDLGANLQAAGEMARFHHSQVPNKLEMESELYKIVGPLLSKMGHNVSAVNGSPMGGYQSIMFVPDKTRSGGLGGYYRAGSDHRKDGQAVGW